MTIDQAREIVSDCGSGDCADEEHNIAKGFIAGYEASRDLVARYEKAFDEIEVRIKDLFWILNVGIERGDDGELKARLHSAMKDLLAMFTDKKLREGTRGEI